jgi:hypothetical protein
MPDPETKFEVEVSGAGGKVAVSGDGAARLANALADFISPVTQPLGAIGDVVENFRIHQKMAATLALERAKEIKRGHNEPLGPVSRKILAPWIEGASSEDVGRENVAELWAQILAAAPESFDSRFAAFIAVARNIGPREDEFLVALAGDQDLNSGFFRNFTFAAENETSVNRYVNNDTVLQELNELTEKVKAVLANGIPKLWLGLVTTVGIFPVQKGAEAGSFLDVVSGTTRRATDILVREGILERLMDTSSTFRFEMRVTYVQATDFGVDLLRTIYSGRSVRS